jgi:hypothetical protein
MTHSFSRRVATSSEKERRSLDATALCNELLHGSLLAQHLQQVRDGLRDPNRHSAHIMINDWFNLHIIAEPPTPPQTAIVTGSATATAPVSPIASPPIGGVGGPSTTAMASSPSNGFKAAPISPSSMSSSTSTPAPPALGGVTNWSASIVSVIRPYHTLLLTTSMNTLLASLPADCSPLLRQLLRFVNPCKSLSALSLLTSIPMAQLNGLVAHLLYWRKARLLHTLSHHYIYVASPHAAPYAALAGHDANPDRLLLLQPSSGNVHHHAHTHHHTHSHHPHSHSVSVPMALNAAAAAIWRDFAAHFPTESLPEVGILNDMHTSSI